MQSLALLDGSLEEQISQREAYVFEDCIFMGCNAV
jgi:hypothetical protein